MSNTKDENNQQEGREEAVDLIRSRLNDLYSHYSSDDSKSSKSHGLIDKFWHAHHNHPDPHSAWQGYYDKLSEDDKQKLWDEYHLRTGALSGVPEVVEQRFHSGSVSEFEEPESQITSNKVRTKPSKARRKRINAAKKLDGKGVFWQFYRNHIWPILSSAMIVGVLWLVFNNELILARVQQYITPNQAVSSPVAIDPSSVVSKEPKIIIPKFNIDLPVVYDVTSFVEEEIQAGLERGVVHYGNTALPGEIGNNVILGHSSNNFFNRGKYKYAFVLIGKLEENDTVILNYKGTRYTYRVFNKQVIEPTDFSLIQPTSKPIVTLITCDPPGTSWRRMVIQAEQISPDPDAAKKVEKTEVNPTETIIPSNAPSLWDRLRDAIF